MGFCATSLYLAWYIHKTLPFALEMMGVVEKLHFPPRFFLPISSPELLTSPYDRFFFLRVAAYLCLTDVCVACGLFIFFPQ